MNGANQDKKSVGQSIQCKSFSTLTVDSYEAGIEMGEALREIQPEVILLFASIYYDFTEFFEAFYSGLGRRNVIIFGGTGDGVYETQQVANNGITGLAINGGGNIQWSMAFSTHVHQTPFEKAQQCAQELVNQSQTPIDFAFVFADKDCDGVKVVEGVGNVLKVPFVGGLTGDDWQFKKGVVFVNGNVYEDAVAILGMSGAFSFAVNTASGWQPVGKTGVVEESHGNILCYIDGKTAFDFLEEQFGMPVSDASLGVFTLAVYESEQSERYFLRTADRIFIESGEVSYFGSIKTGTPVRVCNATNDDVVNGVSEAIQGIGTLAFEPTCAVVISCGARKWLLRERMTEETSRLFDDLGKKIPLVGFPSFGEMGPIRHHDGSYSPVFFHNVSYVLLLLGPAQ